MSKKLVTKLVGNAGVIIDGSNPWDLRVHDDRFYDTVVKYGSLGLGESYMKGWWDSEAVDELIARLLRTGIYESYQAKSLWRTLFNRFVNLQTKRRSLEVGRRHYDIGNHLFQLMLDQGMNYSCGYWLNAENLEQAQSAKLKLICEKLNLEKGMRVLDIGCGWGGFAKYAAEHYGVSVVGVTISKNQLESARKICQGLDVELRLQDYRNLNETFDRIVSIGMFEHVGYKNYPVFFDVIDRCLKDDGLMLLHTNGMNVSSTIADPWITKYIFPNGILPSIVQIAQASEGDLIMEDWHNFSHDYDLTLMAWHHNFNQHWPELSNDYDETFRRMWNYYLLSSAGGFRSRSIQLWQIVFSKHYNRLLYRSLR